MRDVVSAIDNYYFFHRRNNNQGLVPNEVFRSFSLKQNID